MGSAGLLTRSFGRALKDLRAARGLSQEALATRSGLHRTYISILERGLRSPTLETIAALAKALNRLPHALVLAAERAAASRSR